MMTEFFIRSVRLACLNAYDDAVMADVEMTIVCYINGSIEPWKHYPSCIPATRVLFQESAR
jgi:hypothetical protein